MRTNSIIMALLLGTAACASSADPGPATPETTSEAPAAMDAPAPEAPAAQSIAFTPFKLVATPKGGEKAVTVSVAADGTISSDHVKDGKPRGTVGKIVNNEVQDADGKWIVRVTEDGTIEARTTMVMKENGEVSEKTEVKSLGKFLDGDALQGPKGKVSLGDDGMVTLTKPDGATQKLEEMKFEGVTPESRQAAMLMLVAMMAGSVSVETVEESGAPAKAPAATE